MKNQKSLYDNRIRFKFFKKGEFRYLSHLDISRIIIRALNRAGFKLEYSQGYNPRPLINFSNPTPLGIESMAEYADVIIGGSVGEDELKKRINRELNQNVQITEVKKILIKAGKLMNEIGLNFYIFSLDIGESGSESVEEFCKVIDNNLIKGYHSYSAIFDYEIVPERKGYNIILLKLSGYAKIFKEKNNQIFKFNDFYSFLKERLKEYKIKIRNAKKEEMFVIQGDNLRTPMEVI